MRSFTLFVILAALLAAVPVAAQQTGSGGSDTSAAAQRRQISNSIVFFALANVQQEGNFYFLPLADDGSLAISGRVVGGQLAWQMQVILRLLDRFERTRGLEIVGEPTILRDQAAYGSHSYTYGLLVKAVPKKPAAPCAAR